MFEDVLGLCLDFSRLSDLGDSFFRTPHPVAAAEERHCEQICEIRGALDAFVSREDLGCWLQEAQEPDRSERGG